MESLALTPTRPRLVVGAPRCEIECYPIDRRGCGYAVAWRINPHMHVGAADCARAEAQHAALVARLEALGAEVTRLPFVHGAFDSVFVKDSAVLVERDGRREALLARPAFPVRRVEQAPRRAALEGAGFTVHEPPAVELEGGDVVVTSSGPALLGHGFRSSPGAASVLERFLGVAVLPVALREPHLFHLDMALAEVGDSLWVCREALAPASWDDLACAFGSDRLVDVPARDARDFALNVLVLGSDAVLAAGSPAAEERLSRAGLTPHPLELSEFHLGGGSAACLVARVHALDALERDEAPMSRAA